MPVPITVANAGILTLRWAQSGVVSWLNVLGIVNAGNIAFTQALANTIDTGIKAGLASSNFNQALAPRASLVSCGIRDIRTANQAEIVGAGASAPGTATLDEILPLQTALVVTLRTSLAGANYRGRVYLAGFSESFNLATGAAQGGSTPVNFVTAIKTTLTSSGLDLGVLSRPQPNADPPYAGTITTVNAIVLRDSVWDTQRRRAYPGV